MLLASFNREEIVIWVRKKTGNPVMRLSSILAVEEFVKRYDIYVIGLFEKYEVRNLSRAIM